MNRYKRPGWFGESYRHYLASKGVATVQKHGAQVNWALTPGAYYESWDPEKFISLTGTPPSEEYFDEELNQRAPVTVLAEKMQRGAVVPAVFVDSEAPTDHEGRHRVRAALLAGVRSVPVAVRRPANQRTDVIFREFMDRADLAVEGTAYWDEWKRRFSDNNRDPVDFMDNRVSKVYAEVLQDHGLDPYGPAGSEDEIVYMAGK